MKLHAYIDDSRTGDHREANGVFVLAGYVAAPVEWVKFSDEWRNELKQEPKLTSFKMSHFANDFGPWDERLVRFHSIIQRHVRGAFSVVVDLDLLAKYTEGLPSDDREVLLRQPYYLAFLDMVVQMRRGARYIKIEDEIEFVFDEQSKESRILKFVWQQLPLVHPEMAAFVGSEPGRWESDDVHLPIQAADMHAWWTRRNKEAELAGKRFIEPPWPRLPTIPEVNVELAERNLALMFGERGKRA